MASSPRGKILLLMDQPLSNLVSFTLRHLEHEVQSARTLRDAMKLVEVFKPDLVIADYDREPKALQLTEKGARPRAIPVIVMTHRRETQVKLSAYDQGAHDIIEVPFTPDEIVARAVAALRRTRGIRSTIVPRIHVGDLEIDVMTETVRFAEKYFHLTPLQHTLLYLLAANAGQILTRDQIIQDIWGSVDVVDSNVVDRHIRDLRVKLQDSWKEPQFIETIPGKGYRFVSELAKGLDAERVPHFVERTALRQQLSSGPVARVFAEGCRDQITEAREAGKGERVRARCDAEARDLGQAAGDESSLGVVPEPHPVHRTRAESDHVLQSARELDADHVIVRVDAEARCADQRLELARDRGILRRDDRRRGKAARDLACDVRPRQDGDGHARHRLAEDLAHAAAAFGLDALRRRRDRVALADERLQTCRECAYALAWHRDDDALSLRGVLQRRRQCHVVGDGHAREVMRVLAVAREVRHMGLIASPKRYRTTGTPEEHGQRRTPRTRAKDADRRTSGAHSGFPLGTHASNPERAALIPDFPLERMLQIRNERRSGADRVAETRLASGEDAADVVEVPHKNDGAADEDERERRPVERHQTQIRDDEVADERTHDGG